MSLDKKALSQLVSRQRFKKYRRRELNPHHLAVTGF